MDPLEWLLCSAYKACIVLFPLINTALTDSCGQVRRPGGNVLWNEQPVHKAHGSSGSTPPNTVDREEIFLSVITPGQ